MLHRRSTPGSERPEKKDSVPDDDGFFAPREPTAGGQPGNPRTPYLPDEQKPRLRSLMAGASTEPIGPFPDRVTPSHEVRQAPPPGAVDDAIRSLSDRQPSRRPAERHDRQLVDTRRRGRRYVRRPGLGVATERARPGGCVDLAAGLASARRMKIHCRADRAGRGPDPVRSAGHRGEPYFRVKPDAKKVIIPPAMSMLRGRLTAAEAAEAVLLAQGPSDRDRARYTVARRFTEAGFLVEHTPNRRNPLRFCGEAFKRECFT